MPVAKPIRRKVLRCERCHKERSLVFEEGAEPSKLYICTVCATVRRLTCRTCGADCGPCRMCVGLAEASHDERVRDLEDALSIAQTYRDMNMRECVARSERCAELQKEVDALRAEITALKGQQAHRLVPAAKLCEWCRQPAVNDDAGVCCDTRRRKDELARRKMRDAFFTALAPARHGRRWLYVLFTWGAAIAAAVAIATRTLGVSP